MYINNINILYYLFLGIIGLGIGQFVAWSTVRLPDYKKVFVREFFTIYLKNEKPKYIYMVAMTLLYVGVLYLYGFQIKTLAYLALIPMLISALAIDYRLKIIPNRLNLTIFEVGLVYTFVEGIVNINIAIDMLLGMVAGAGIFLFISRRLNCWKRSNGVRRCKTNGSTWFILRLENNNYNFTYCLLIRSNNWSSINNL